MSEEENQENPKFSNSHLEKSLGDLLKSSDTSKTKDKIIIDLNHNDGRWEYLYKLNKLKQIKNHYITEISAKEDINKELAECTFSPKINKKILGNKYIYVSRCNSPSIKSSISNVNQNRLISPNSNSYVKTETQKNKNENNNNSNKNNKKSLLDYGILERQLITQNSKNSKVDYLKSLQDEKEIEECNFQPKINSSDYKSKLDITNKATELISDPIGYEQYIYRLTKFREEKILTEKKNKKILNIIDKDTKITKAPRILNNLNDFKNPRKLITKNNTERDTINIQSLDGPMRQHRFKLKRNELYESHNFKKKNMEKENEMIFIDNTKGDICDLVGVKEKDLIDIKGPVLYKDAINYIHNQLHAIDFDC